MGEVWPTAHITELCLQLTVSGSRPVNGDEHRAIRAQSCERALLTMDDFTLLFLPPAPTLDVNIGRPRRRDRDAASVEEGWGMRRQYLLPQPIS